MSNTRKAFENGKAFIPFVTCGDPDLETTKAIVFEAVKAGADLIELGIPFSDPTAEGPVIMDASLRALNGGVTTDRIFDMVEDIRKTCSIPLAFMTYANVIFSYGSERFLDRCAALSVDALILPDIPFEEKGEFADICNARGVDLISFIAPTSEDRIATIAREAKGFIYLVSSLGVTGTRTEIKTDLSSIGAKIRENTDVPFAIGFGISTPKQAEELSKVADGIIVGSAIVKLVAQYGKDAPEHVGKYIKSMTEAMGQR